MTVTIVHLDSRDRGVVEASRRLLNGELGDGIYPAERYAGMAIDPEVGIMLAANPRGLLGASVARILYPEDVDYYSAFGEMARRLFADHRVGSLEGLAVIAEARRQGIGRRLVEARMTWLATRGCTAAVAVSWLSGRQDASASLYRSLGFTESIEVANFYHEESIRDGWRCPRCGNPCRCSASLFQLALTSVSGSEDRRR